MFIPFLVGLRLVAATDSSTYTVYNHDRPAGTMVVSRWADSIRVRYIFTDRNRGTRVETRYRVIGDSVLATETRPVLANGAAGAPTLRIERRGRWRISSS